MGRGTKFLGSASGMLALAAFGGLVGGTSARAGASAASVTGNSSTTVAYHAQPGVQARTLDSTPSHDCKGKNDCKGQGGCSTSDGGCKGKNSCKGKGGCKTSGATTQKLSISSSWQLVN